MHPQPNRGQPGYCLTKTEVYQEDKRLRYNDRVQYVEDREWDNDYYEGVFRI